MTIAAGTILGRSEIRSKIGAGGMGAATLRGAASKLWSQPLDGGPPKQLADFNPDQLFSFALSTDGRQLAFARGAVSRDIILITDSR